LLSDINKVMEATDEEVDSYLGTFTANTKAKREFMWRIHLSKEKKLAEIAREMYLKWGNL